MPLPANVRRERRAYNKLHNSEPAAPVVKKKPRRKRCDNCFKLMEMTIAHKRFCCEQCKKEFHQNGGAFGPLKARLEKLVTKLTKATREEIQSQISALVEIQNVLGKRVAALENTHALDVRALRDEIRMEVDRAS